MVQINKPTVDPSAEQAAVEAEKAAKAAEEKAKAAAAEEEKKRIEAAKNAAPVKSKTVKSQTPADWHIETHDEGIRATYRDLVYVGPHKGFVKYLQE